MTPDYLKDGNFLPHDGFRVTIDKYPTIGPLCQGIYIPGMMLGEAMHATPFIDRSAPGDKIVFEKFNATVALDENLDVYREIHAWLKGLGFPESYSQYGKTQLPIRERPVIDDIYSDISVIILNSKSNPNLEFVFKEAYPITMGGFQLDTTSADSIHLTVDVSFTFRTYDIKRFGEVVESVV